MAFLQTVGAFFSNYFDLISRLPQLYHEDLPTFLKVAGSLLLVLLFLVLLIVMLVNTSPKKKKKAAAKHFSTEEIVEAAEKLHLNDEVNDDEGGERP